MIWASTESSPLPTSPESISTRVRSATRSSAARPSATESRSSASTTAMMSYWSMDSYCSGAMSATESLMTNAHTMSAVQPMIPATVMKKRFL